MTSDDKLEQAQKHMEKIDAQNRQDVTNDNYNSLSRESY